jgi:hypothetical protein
MINTRTTTSPRVRLLAITSFLLLALPLLPSPASATHEFEVDEVPGQYILFLNLVAMGNYLADSSQVPTEFGAYFDQFEDLYSAQVGLMNLPSIRNRVENLAILWGSAGWRARFVEKAQEVWSQIIRDLLLVQPIETHGTSALLELDTSASRRPASILKQPGLLATTAGQDKTAPLVLQPNYRLSPARVPNDPLFHAQWALEKARVAEAWDRVDGSSAVIVSVIDSGYDPEQLELIRQLWPGDLSTQYRPGRGFCDENANLDPPEPCNTEDIADETGHGTAMAGIVGASTDDRLRVAGTNWHVGLMILKVLGRDNRGSVWDVAKAIRFAADHGARVISLSLGGRPKDGQARGALRDAIIYASGRNQPGQASQSLVVVAAGNENLNLDDPAKALLFPASFKVTHPCLPNDWCFDNLVVVGATDRDDGKAPFSNYGKKVVDLGAPGVAIITTGLEENWGVAEVTGTSASTALVAGVAALVEATRNPPCDPAQTLCYLLLKEQLLDGADRVSGLCDSFDKGRRLNANDAVLDRGPPAEPCP